MTLADGNEESTVYLVEVEDQDDFEEWLASNYRELFEEELNGWYTDPELWPQERSLKTFKKWCSFELHSVIFDKGGAPLFDDEV